MHLEIPGQLATVCRLELPALSLRVLAAPIGRFNLVFHRR